MIDIITTETRDLKNITQIGTPNSDEKIYIEDSAYARLHMDELQEKRVFVLMGHTQHMEGAYTSFVEAVIPVSEAAFEGNTPLWTNGVWNSVFREIRQFYENLIVVGWALDLKGIAPRVTEELEAIHREHFGGAHQMLLLINSADNEEYFYLNKNNHLYRKDGFYIYYRTPKKHTPQPEAPKRIRIPELREERRAVQSRPDMPEAGERRPSREERNSLPRRAQGRYREMLLSQEETPAASRSHLGSVAVFAVAVLAAAVIGTVLSRHPGQTEKVESFLTTLSQKVSERGITLLPPDTESEPREGDDGAEENSRKQGAEDGGAEGESRKQGTDDGRAEEDSRKQGTDDGGTQGESRDQKDDGDGRKEDSQGKDGTEAAYTPVERIDGGIPTQGE